MLVLSGCFCSELVGCSFCKRQPLRVCIKGAAPIWEASEGGNLQIFLDSSSGALWSLCGSFGFFNDTLQTGGTFSLFSSRPALFVSYSRDDLKVKPLFGAEGAAGVSDWKPVECGPLGSVQTELCQILLCSRFFFSVSFRRPRRPVLSSQPCCVAGLCGRGEYVQRKFSEQRFVYSSCKLKAHLPGFHGGAQSGTERPLWSHCDAVRCFMTFVLQQDSYSKNTNNI